MAPPHKRPITARRHCASRARPAQQAFASADLADHGKAQYHTDRTRWWGMLGMAVSWSAMRFTRIHRPANRDCSCAYSHRAFGSRRRNRKAPSLLRHAPRAGTAAMSGRTLDDGLEEGDTPSDSRSFAKSYRKKSMSTAFSVLAASGCSFTISRRMSSTLQMLQPLDVPTTWRLAA